MKEYIIKIGDEPDIMGNYPLTEKAKELVRCKDCEHRPTYPEAHGAEIDGKWCYWCERLMAWKHDDWFCADGKRR